MNFNEEELLKINKATSGLFKKKAQNAVAQALLIVKSRIDTANKFDEPKRQKVNWSCFT